jgi:hypothetical protein
LTAGGNQKTVKKWKYLIIGPSMVLSEDSRKHKNDTEALLAVLISGR